MINLISFVTKTYAVIVINLLLIDFEAIRNQGIANLVVCIKEGIYLFKSYTLVSSRPSTFQTFRPCNIELNCELEKFHVCVCISSLITMQ